MNKNEVNFESIEIALNLGGSPFFLLAAFDSFTYIIIIEMIEFKAAFLLPIYWCFIFFFFFSYNFLSTSLEVRFCLRIFLVVAIEILLILNIMKPDVTKCPYLPSK